MPRSAMGCGPLFESLGASDGLVSLRTTSREHHARMLPHVDRLLEIAGMIGQAGCAELHPVFDEESRFLADELVPHMETIERTLYDRIEAELSGHHSLAPMREEHETIRRLTAELAAYRGHAETCSWSTVEGMAIRRALYRLHALLKVHLAEEELYLEVLERNLAGPEKDALARAISHAASEGL